MKVPNIRKEISHMVRINGEDKALAGINLLGILKRCWIPTGKDCGRTKSGNNPARSVRKCGDSG